MEYAPAPFHIAAVRALHLRECKLPGLWTPQMSLSVVWLGSAETQEAFIAIILSWLMPNMNSSSRDQKKKYSPHSSIHNAQDCSQEESA